MPMQVFDAMFRLCADSDSNVMNAVTFLDNLVKVNALGGFKCDVVIKLCADVLLLGGVGGVEKHRL
jgi:hypothetical protein